MNCWHCGRPADGVCRFCGRGLCREHARTFPHIETLYRSEQGVQKALVVANALFCGLCNPREDPVELPQLK